jgi:hypothetical protein
MVPSAGAYWPFEGFTAGPSLEKERFRSSPPQHIPWGGGLAMLFPLRLKRRSQIVASEAHRLLMHLFILSLVLSAAFAAWLH